MLEASTPAGGTNDVAFTRDSIPDLTGRTAVVTGANGGLGLETAKALAAKGAHVVMAARNLAKAAEAAEQIRAETPNASLEVAPLDLGLMGSVRDAAERIVAGHDRIDILVNNAGVMAMPEKQTADGFEMQFGVNHLGHWALTALLMPALLAAPASPSPRRCSPGCRYGRGRPRSAQLRPGPSPSNRGRAVLPPATRSVSQPGSARPPRRPWPGCAPPSPHARPWPPTPSRSPAPARRWLR